MKKALLLIFLYPIYSMPVYVQSNQQKAQELASSYLSNKAGQNIKFSAVKVLRSSFAETRQYKILIQKIDSLKLEGRKIDARIPKMKTTAEISQAKKDSKSLSNQLVATSDQLLDFMTKYKGPQTGWIIKSVPANKNIARKTFYLNLELTKVDSLG